VPELLRVFDRDELAALAGTSSVSLGRYLSGSRAWPDDLAARIHWLALVLSDLEGAYNRFGVMRDVHRVMCWERNGIPLPQRLRGFADSPPVWPALVGRLDRLSSR
jgi:hypothetical protein